MTSLRLVLGLCLLVAALALRPATALAAACDSVHLYTLHTAEKNAWDNQKMDTLLSLNVEEAKYTDSCGHKETGKQRTDDLYLAATHYSDAAGVERGKGNFDLAIKYFKRSNEIIAEIYKDVPEQGQPLLKDKQTYNTDGIKKAKAKIATG